MYLSDRFLRSLSPESISAADQRAADERIGRFFAALSRGSRRVTGWGHTLTVVLSVAVGTSAGFRNEVRRVSPPADPELAPPGLARAANGRGISPQ
jgi:hypothetical protein